MDALERSFLMSRFTRERFEIPPTEEERKRLDEQQRRGRTETLSISSVSLTTREETTVPAGRSSRGTRTQMDGGDLKEPREDQALVS